MRQANLLVRKFKDVFSEVLGQTAMMFHHINTEPGKVVRKAIWSTPKKMQVTVKEELEKTKKLGVTIESQSDGIVQ